MFMIKRGPKVIGLWEAMDIRILLEEDPTIELVLPQAVVQRLGLGGGEEWGGVFYFTNSSQASQQLEQLTVTVFAVNERRNVGVCGRVEVSFDQWIGQWLDQVMVEETVDGKIKYHGVRICFNVPVFSRRLVRLSRWLYPFEWTVNRLIGLFHRQNIVFLRCRKIRRGIPNAPGGWEEVMDPQSATRPAEGEEYKRRWN
ncbi:MAG: hypothetical protein UT11_C0030G0004 [Berkelbacteria bacterium GW2011_GWA2_38_9]|uniref:Uncharacterized protein n=1 Tax=Berkelbacteria bacterium GW2011_GWA2_38_9 TaxID=1618334 RepID=A0A0G0NTT9_9BACT|nr:MAG: hypothetical protein UT11_C0030G0004 [Berkelbacteria bacterium GW2011_GWA2_38_9]